MMHTSTRLLSITLLSGIVLLSACAGKKTAQKEDAAPAPEETTRLQPDSTRMQPMNSSPTLNTSSEPALATPPGSGGDNSGRPMSDQAAPPAQGGAQAGSGKLPSEGQNELPPPVTTGKIDPSQLPSSGGAPANASRLERARQALKADRVFDRVSVDNGPEGCLVLAGSVASMEQRERAFNVALNASSGCIQNQIKAPK